MKQTIQETIKDTDKPVTVKGFRSASSETPNLGLPIVSGTDVYSPLTDWNQSMEKIDSAVGLVELMGSVNKIEIEKIKADNTRQDAELDAIRQVDETQTEWLVDQQGSINNLKVSNDTIEKDIIEQNALIKNLTNRVLEVEDKLDPDSGEVAAEIEANTALIRSHWQGNEMTPPAGIRSNMDLTTGLSSISGGGSYPIVKWVTQNSGVPINLVIQNTELYPAGGIREGRIYDVIVEVFFKRTDLGSNFGNMYGVTAITGYGEPEVLTAVDLKSASTRNDFTITLGENKMTISANAPLNTGVVYFKIQVVRFR